MKLTRIKVPEFIHVDDFGSYRAQEVAILFDPKENEITRENFNQKKHLYYLDSEEIDRLSKEAAQGDLAALLTPDPKSILADQIKA